jgi:hypothetical protein
LPDVQVHKTILGSKQEEQSGKCRCVLALHFT